MEGLGFLSDAWDAPESRVMDMTADGSVLVGFASSRPSDAGRYLEAFRWSEDDGMVSMSDHDLNSSANAVSDDGELVVGEAHCADPAALSTFLRWRGESGLQDVECGGNDRLIGVSGDGRVALSANGYLSLDGGAPVAFTDVLAAGDFEPEGRVFYDFRALSGSGLAVVALATQPGGGVDGVVVTFADCNDNAVPDALEKALGARVECAVTEFIRGDANLDASWSVSDAITILNQLFAGEPQRCAKASDVDDDGRLTITDPIFFLRHMFFGGLVIPQPSFTCGIDPTPDSLSCELGC